MTTDLTDAVEQVLGLHAETVSVSRRRIAGDTTRVSTSIKQTEVPVREALTHQRVEVRRVAIGREIDSVPAVRTEGGTTIIPVVEEEIVIQRRLILKEEVHLERKTVSESFETTVTLREEVAVIERISEHKPLFSTGKASAAQS